MFSALTGFILIILFVSLVVIPVYIRIYKDLLFEEWSQMWKREVEAEKRRAVMQEVNKERKKKKTK